MRKLLLVLVAVGLFTWRVIYYYSEASVQDSIDAPLDYQDYFVERV